MGARRRAAFALGTAALAAALAIPLPASAQTGGTAPPSARDEPGDPSVQIISKRAAYVGRALRIRGKATNAARRSVRIEVRGSDGLWMPAATDRAGRRGRFSARWMPSSTGYYAVRAIVSGAGSASSGGSAARTSPARALTVYKLATATWYGPGFYGNRTACGVELTRETLGVAHRRLPCGTQVEIAFRGRTIVVPVIDRGPYARGVRWDLTGATAERLGFTVTSRIGAVAINPGR